LEGPGTYSYGDSPGFSPDSLFIRNIGTACFAKIIDIYIPFHKIKILFINITKKVFQLNIYSFDYMYIKKINIYKIFPK
jgi:hypothetical protein